MIGIGQARGHRGDLPAQLHRRRDADRARQGRHRLAEDQRAARGSWDRDASTARRKASRRWMTASRSIPPKGISPSTASIPRSAATRIRNWPRCWARELSADCCILVDSHQRTSVPGLYAAGDVVIGLDQISHAMGEGGVAATTIRNDLAKAAAASCANQARKSGSRTILPSHEVGDRRRGTGSASACRRAFRSRATSPAPKFSIATTVPSDVAVADRRTAGRSGRHDNIRPRRAAAARRGRSRPVSRAMPRRLSRSATPSNRAIARLVAALATSLSSSGCPPTVSVGWRARLSMPSPNSFRRTSPAHAMRPGDRGERDALRGRR